MGSDMFVVLGSKQCFLWFVIVISITVIVVLTSITISVFVRSLFKVVVIALFCGFVIIYTIIAVIIAIVVIIIIILAPCAVVMYEY